MNIGIIIGRIGDVDGVALETEKWITVLKRMGHDVFVLSGRFKESRRDRHPPGEPDPATRALLLLTRVRVGAESRFLLSARRSRRAAHHRS